MYQITEIATGNVVIESLTYQEAMRYMQKNRLNRNEYSVDLYMPKRAK